MKIFIILILIPAFAFNVSAQAKIENNKLNNSTFSLIEKLRNLKLLVSTEKDVKKLFGKSCRRPSIYRCSYKNDWSMHFEYVESVRFTTDVSSGKQLIYKPRSSEYLGKLLSINALSYPDWSDFVYKSNFVTDSFISSENLKCVKTFTFNAFSKEKLNSRVCSDNQGLVYFIYDEITLNGKLYKKFLWNISLTLPDEKYKEIIILDKQ